MAGMPEMQEQFPAGHKEKARLAPGFFVLR
jgi:hypothetical protein